MYEHHFYVNLFIKGHGEALMIGLIYLISLGRGWRLEYLKRTKDWSFSLGLEICFGVEEFKFSFELGPQDG